MAASRSYTWQRGDDIYRVAARYFLQDDTGWPDVSTWVDDPANGIRVNNQVLTLPDGSVTNVVDFRRLPIGTRIVLPYLS